VEAICFLSKMNYDTKTSREEKVDAAVDFLFPVNFPTGFF